MKRQAERHQQEHAGKLRQHAARKRVGSACRSGHGDVRDLVQRQAGPEAVGGAA
ncbi:hypothetical protein OMP38_29040 [Cohnella ginsengisoli]|uniref:Uncharacterized protein n=1 Tax=Cohnella ginsengisoli TaxID=425004 RepID=A0A9X4KRM5_9BACL|nr:hypothetical protein [Cohnella ginsengisoli]MDG0794430.1 hypothetical protein [Cohnella ginsengisoli]